MINLVLKNFIRFRSRLLLKKQFDSIALYKPIEVQVEGLMFSSHLIDTCHHLHKGMIAILKRTDKDLIGEEKADAENSHDYVAALLLQNYFTVWCNDVKDMHRLTEGGE